MEYSKMTKTIRAFAIAALLLIGCASVAIATAPDSDAQNINGNGFNLYPGFAAAL
jgi:hypothetical protein